MLSNKSRSLESKPFFHSSRVSNFVGAGDFRVLIGYLRLVVFGQPLALADYDAKNEERVDRDSESEIIAISNYEGIAMISNDEEVGI